VDVAPPSFRIGRANAHVIVSPNRRAFPEAAEYWDGNWVYATVSIAAGGFRGDFEARLRTEEFVRFRDELRPLHDNLVGRATFATMEEWLSLDVAGDGNGHFHADCIAVDMAGTGNRLTFAIDFDQTDLTEILKGLDAITKTFPVIGAPYAPPHLHPNVTAVAAGSPSADFSAPSGPHLY
jgi:hypothetical protein